MNIKFLSLSLLITAAAGLGFVQTANASDEDGQPSRPSGRFNYAPNLFKMEEPTGPRHFNPLPYAPKASSPAGSVKAGSVPKMAPLDTSFLAPVKPIPQVPTIAPIVNSNIVPKQTTFTSIPKSNSPFSSIFGNPQPLVATNAPPIAPIKAQPAAAPAPTHVATQGTARLLTPQHRHVVASHAPASGGFPAIQTYGPQGYSIGQTLPTSVGNGSSVSTNVSGVLRHH